jgi:hypothetical protein
MVRSVWRSRAHKALSIVLGVTVGLVLGETALRIHAAATARDYELDLLRTWNAEPPPFVDGCGPDHAQAGLAEIVRPSPWPDVVYELKPNIDTCFDGARVKTNVDGLRAPKNYQRPKPVGTWRVVLLGDSQTFGHGVGYEETFGALLERELSQRTTLDVEIINTAVHGYNTAMEAEHLARYGITWEPDCILILFIGNDLGLPHLMLRSRDPFTTKESFVFTTVRRSLGESAVANGSQRVPWFEVAGPPFHRFVPEEDLDRVPARYRHMVGWAGYRRALEKIAALARQRDATVVNFADYTSRSSDAAEIIAFQRGLGIVHPTFVYPGDSKYVLSEKDTHLNVEGTAEIMRRMLAGLDETRACLPSTGARR